MSLFAAEYGGVEQAVSSGEPEAVAASEETERDEAQSQAVAAGAPATLWTTAGLLPPPYAPPGIFAVQAEAQPAGNIGSRTEREAEPSCGSCAAAAVPSERTSRVLPARSVEPLDGSSGHPGSEGFRLTDTGLPELEEARLAAFTTAEAEQNGGGTTPPASAAADHLEENLPPRAAMAAGLPVRERSIGVRPAAEAEAQRAPAAAGLTPNAPPETNPEDSAIPPAAVAERLPQTAHAKSNEGARRQLRAGQEQGSARMEGGKMRAETDRADSFPATQPASLHRDGRRAANPDEAEGSRPGSERGSEAKAAFQPEGRQEPASGLGPDAARQAPEGHSGSAAGGSAAARGAAAGGGETRQAAPVRTATEPFPEPGPRRLMLRVEGDQGQRVDIRLSQSPGSLRVRLSSLQAGLAEGLRAQIHQLERSLEAAGWRAEVGVSAEAASRVASDTESSPARDFSGDSGAGREDRADLDSRFPAGGNRQGGSQKGAELEEEFLDLSAIRRLRRERTA